MNDEYDILIVGGGMVGASLACALQRLPLRIGLIEAVRPDDPEQPSYDDRAIALSQGSKRIFEALGVWPAMEQAGVTAIERIHVSDRGHFGAARLNAREEGVEALGYVAEARAIGRGLSMAMSQLSNAEMICPARLTALESAGGSAYATVDCDGQSRTLQAKLVVAADGGRSTVRELVGGRTWRVGYGQTAIIAHVTTDRPHRHIAYERFTDSGPLALLPSGGLNEEARPDGARRWSLVWSARDAQVQEILALDDATFLARLQERFGGRAGRFLTVGPRHAYPLGLQYLRDQVRPNLLFIGNAAHTIHPVAGQGFNLGLRDVAVLAEVLANAVEQGAPIGAEVTLKRYAEWRRGDYLRVMGLTDGLARLFSSRLKPLTLARDLGMVTLDLLPTAHHALARQMMGLTGRLPRLARGVAL